MRRTAEEYLVRAIGELSVAERHKQKHAGVCPPAGVDPGIAAPPVGGGTTPVIPPPGTPGGDPNIIPK
jgi:hypothetical protein